MHVFFIVGIMYLILNTIKDLRTFKVDDRYNYFMLGVACMVMFVEHSNFWHTLGVIFFSVLVTMAYKWAKFGNGDLSAFLWINLGLGALHTFYLLVFWSIMLLLQLIIAFALPKGQRIPFYPFITIAFIMVTASSFYL